MKFNRILIIAVLLLIFAIGAVSACEDVNTTDDVVSSDNVNEVSSDDYDEDYTDVEIEIPEEVFDEDDPVEIRLPDGVSGTLSLEINGSKINLEKGTIDEEGDDDDDRIYINRGSLSVDLDTEDYNDFEIILSTLDKGIYDIKVTFETASKTYSNSSIVRVGDVPTDEEVSIDAEDSYVQGQSNKIIIDAPESLIDNLDIKINGESYKSDKIADQRVVDISKLIAGHYTIVVSYNNGKNSTSEDFDVYIGIAFPTEMEYASPEYVILKLDDDAKGNLTVKIDNKEIGNVKLVNGEAKVSIPSLSVGFHNISAKYTGSDFDIEAIEDEEFEIFPKVTCPYEMNVGENVYLIIEVGNTAGKVTVETDEGIYRTLNINGKASINLADLDDEDYTITVIFSGSDGMEWEEDYDLMVYPASPRVTGAKDISMLYSAKVNYKLAVYGTNSKLAENKELVEFKINGRTYDAYTDKNGVVTFEIPKLAPGKYDITAIYDDHVCAKTKLVVKHLLKLKKAKIKKSAKKLVIKASLKKVNGKYLKGEKITLKFKGKKYTAKTNKKGVAKFKIDKKILKKLKAGKKISYQAVYLKDTVKKSVKVKK